MRTLPTIEQLEPAAREYCRLCGDDPDSKIKGNPKPRWMHIAISLRYELATSWALDVFERSKEQQQ